MVSWARCRRSEEHTFELQSRENLVCRLLLEKKKFRVDLSSFFDHLLDLCLLILRIHSRVSSMVIYLLKFPISPPSTSILDLASLFLFPHTATPVIYTLSLHDALPICPRRRRRRPRPRCRRWSAGPGAGDRKSTRLNSSHVKISYAVFCLKKKNFELISLHSLIIF